MGDVEKKTNFFTGVKSEFKKISWPDKHSTFKQSVAVVAISVVVGVIIAIIDFIIQNGVNFLTSIFFIYLIWFLRYRMTQKTYFCLQRYSFFFILTQFNDGIYQQVVKTSALWRNYPF